MKKNIRLVLFIKVFIILLVAGIILPDLISLILNKVVIIDDQMPSGNSVYVMYRETYSKSFGNILKDTLVKFINF